MIFENEETLTIISIEQEATLELVVESLTVEMSNLKNQNLILDISNFKEFSQANAKSFLNISKKHRKNGKSFVPLNKYVSYDNIPEELNVVPTIQEARDIIEMEEIERDLGL